MSSSALSARTSVHVKLEGKGGFGAIEVAEGDVVSDVVKRACSENASYWAVVAPQVAPFLVASGGLQPSPAVIALATSPLDTGLSLRDAGVGPGAWLVLRRFPDDEDSSDTFGGRGSVTLAAISAQIASLAAGQTSLVTAQTSLAAGQTSLAAGQTSLTTDVAFIKSRLPDDDAATPFTPADYEQSARVYLRDHVLPQWCGLQVVQGVRLERLEGDIVQDGSTNIQWDFRAPVMVAHAPPSMPSQSLNLVIYPTWPAYVRPAKPLSQARLTPTKVAGASEPPAADYMAIFEVTIQDNWAKADRHGSSLLTRLEERLFVTLARANALRSASIDKALDILDVVAVVGVVGVFNCQRSIVMLRARSVRDDAIRPAASSLLWRLMDAGRFVFVRKPYGDPSCGGSPAVSAGA